MSLAPISSLIHDQLRCVTLQGCPGTSRAQASELLKQVVKDDREYQASYVQCNAIKESDVKCTGMHGINSWIEPLNGISHSLCFVVFHLVTTALCKNSPHTLVALALKDAGESIATAHERDRLYPGLDMAFSVIAPSSQIKLLISEKKKQRDADDCTEAMEEEQAPAPLNKRPKKTTTAAAYFEKKQPAATVPTASVATEKKQSAVIGKKQTAAVATTTKPSKVSVSNKKPSASGVAKKEDEKENKVAVQEKVGNADDFVGDVEESDSDESMEVEPVSKTKQPTIDDLDSDTSEPTKKNQFKKNKSDIVVIGAMDAFAMKKELAPVQVGHKRRRKKLVQTTTKDDSGYLHTETQEVWEDIPTDEEQEEIKKSSMVAVKKIQPVANKGAKKDKMKQGSLMGFFTKK
jgi:hypothetical protein